MALGHLEGITYGPVRTSIAAAKVAEYVVATGNAEPARWATAAPPSYAGALLFVVAPVFLASEDVAGHTAVLIHADQTFMWHEPLTIGAGVDVRGRIDRVRSRGGIDFVTFAASVTDREDGRVLLDSISTFLLGAEAAGEPPVPRDEPAVGDRRRWDPLSDIADGAARSASRLDLVRYAGASGDFNPIHFDHDAAVGAGLAGVVVHGLLMAAWILDAACGLDPGDRPIARAKLRFREPLYAGEAAILDGTVNNSGSGVDLGLVSASDGGTLVTAHIDMAGA